MTAIKESIKRAFYLLGLEVRRASGKPGTQRRPIGNIRCFLEDIKSRGFEPRGLIDVGANRGDWTRLAWKVFPRIPVLMIEPQDEMDAPLSLLAAKMPSCNYVKAGAGREDGELVQTIAEDLAGSSFLPEVDAIQLATGKQRKTKIVALDNLLRASHRDFHPDLVKLDVQGFELEVLQGARSLFGRTEIFILETSLFHFSQKIPTTREIITFMGVRGYELYDITNYLRRPYDGALGQVDLAFAKIHGLLRMKSAW
jgi:FkbM family methyltransferase